MMTEPVTMPTKAGPEVGDHRQDRGLQRVAPDDDVVVGRPLARAVRMKLERSTSSIDERVIRAIEAM